MRAPPDPAIEQSAQLSLLRPAVFAGLLIVLSLALNWYYTLGGFQADEFFFLNMLRADPLPFSRLHGLWSRCDAPGLVNLWWIRGMPELAFWRPLPSLVFEASIRLFGENAFPLHLLSVVLHGLVAATLFLLVRRLSARPFLGALAALLFLCCEDHSMGIGWIATNTDLICALFVNLAFLGHAHWLRTRRPWALVAALAALVPAFLSKESAALVPLGMALLTFAMPHGRDEAGPSSLRERAARFLGDWPSWAPALTLMIVYLAVYKGLGYGALQSGMYVDPFSAPLRFLRHAALQLPVMWLATLSPAPPSLAMFLPGATPALAVAGMALAVVMVAALWPLRRSRLVAWAIGCYLIVLLPQAATFASERGLYLPVIFSSVALGALVAQTGPIRRLMQSGSSRPPALTRACSWYVLVVVLFCGAVLSTVMPFSYRPSLDRPRRDYTPIVALVEERSPDHVLVLNTPGPFHTLYGPEIVSFFAGRPIDLRVLSSMNGIVSVERIDDHQLELRVDRAGWLTNVFAAMLRSPGSLEPGEVFENEVLTATLVELTRSGRDALAVRFRLRRPLGDPGLLFVTWNGERFEPIDLAALPVGEPRTLADTSDVWASMT